MSFSTWPWAFCYFRNNYTAQVFCLGVKVSLSASSLPSPCRFTICRPSNWASYIKGVLFLQQEAPARTFLLPTALHPASWRITLYRPSIRKLNRNCALFPEPQTTQRSYLLIFIGSALKSTKRFICLTPKCKHHVAPQSPCSAATKLWRCLKYLGAYIFAINDPWVPKFLHSISV